MGLFLGTIILFTILEIKESKRIIRESKHSNKSMTEIAEETADEIEIEKIKILKYVKADKLVIIVLVSDYIIFSEYYGL